MISKALAFVLGFAICTLLLTPDDSLAAHSGTDILYFEAATAGVDHDHDGRYEWCYTTYYHGQFGDALDEVPETSPGVCPSLSDQRVEVQAYGWTSDTACLVNNPCHSVRGQGHDGVYQDACDFIEVNLFDYLIGDWKGMQRMLHSRDNFPTWLVDLYVSNSSNYLNWWNVGFVVDDSDCQGGAGWTNYHVHHDFKKVPNSALCGANQNNALVVRTYGWEKPVFPNWVHGVYYHYGQPC